MRPLWLLLASVLALNSVTATDAPKVRMPVISTPAPVVAPDAPVKLTPDRLFVVDSDIALLVLCSPDGPLKVTAEEGPLRIRGKFADGPDKVETRTYKGKFIYTVDVVEGKSGRCELLVIPKGVQDEKEVIRRLIDAGNGPQPPPVPPDPPKPDPQPGPDNSPSKLYAVVIEETQDAVAQRGVWFSNADILARFQAKQHQWRVVDKDVRGADGQPPADIRRFLETAKGKKLPQLFLVDPKGKDRTGGGVDMPATAAEFLALLTKFGG